MVSKTKRLGTAKRGALSSKRTKKMIKVIKTRTKSRKANRRSAPSLAGAAMLIADARKLVHVPTPMPTGPYTVVHSRSVTSITTNAFGQKTVLLVSSFADAAGTNGGTNVLPMHGVHGVGTNVPGTTESYIYDPLLAGAAAGTYQLSCHAITVSVTCADSALSASGLVYMGTLPLRLTRTNFVSWNTLADNLTPRAEMKSFTAFTSLQNSELAVRHASVMDAVSWSEFNPSAANVTGSSVVMRDALSTICVFFTPTTAAVNYQVTIHVEWRVIYNVDQQLASTQKLYQPSPMSVVSAARAALSSTGGMLLRPGMNTGDAFLGSSWNPNSFSADNRRVISQ